MLFPLCGWLRECVRWAVDSTTEHTGNEGKKVMRIVLIGISHWHTPFYSDPVLGMKNATIVGVSDAERGAPLAAQAKCPVSLACLNLVAFSWVCCRGRDSKAWRKRGHDQTRVRIPLGPGPIRKPIRRYRRRRSPPQANSSRGRIPFTAPLRALRTGQRGTRLSVHSRIVRASDVVAI